MTPDRSSAMDHVVLAMFENRSLDNLLGHLYGPEDGKTVARHVGSDAIRRDWPGLRATVARSEVVMAPTRAEHSSELVWTNPATGKAETHVGGEPGGFIIEFENGFKLYHMGDTGLFADMKWIAEYYKPDLIMIPIGGHFVMSPKDAADATNH